MGQRIETLGGLNPSGVVHSPIRAIKSSVCSFYKFYGTYFNLEITRGGLYGNEHTDHNQLVYSVDTRQSLALSSTCRPKAG